MKDYSGWSFLASLSLYCGITEVSDGKKIIYQGLDHDNSRPLRHSNQLSV
jgi:hypothetical protein